MENISAEEQTEECAGTVSKEVDYEKVDETNCRCYPKLINRRVERQR